MAQRIREAISDQEEVTRVEGWLADIVPHARFGLATAGVFDVLEGGRRSGRCARGRG